MEKTYDHKKFEDQIYNNWENSGKMQADVNSAKKPFTIVLPPPNVTGQLHLGHAAMLAIEDIMIRHQKMSGKEVCWVPGTDHAAIATENVVIKHLGIKSREELSRTDFLAECRKFAGEKHDRIVHQIRKMGAWLDWGREAYTFDEKRNFAVNTIFEQLYNDGLIVRGHRLINWSVGAQSVLADDEVEWGEEVEPFYYIKCGEFIIGTVRSETKCADSPLIVNPKADYLRVKYTSKSREISETFILVKNCWENEVERKKVLNLLDEEGSWEILETFKGKDLAGQEFEYDTYAGKRKFVIIADEVVDPEKGSGAMTISCNHSADDYDLGKRLSLDEYFFDKVDFAGKMLKVSGPCTGMEIKKARKFAGNLMKEQGLLTGIDHNYSHRVPVCYRSNCVVEPMVSPQWFISVEKEFTDKFTGEKTTLKKLTQNAVREKNIDVIPARFEKTYFQWIDNLRDWCISRQIWWGHQIPVFYCQDCQAENIFPASKINDKKCCKKCQSEDLKQDEDTLDTWFSSALWPFSTLGWPDKNSRDLKKFYPNDVMETGHDIIFFWVARMIMFGRYATGKYPFKTVYLHGLVCDEKGKKMSKSAGNGIDPLELIEEVGADAVRLSLVIGTTPGNPIPIGKNKIKGYRNFVNKMWNAGRFVQMQLENTEDISSEIKPESIADKWILDRFTKISREINEHLNKYEISIAGDKIYHFVWGEFCDWYLEAHKVSPNPFFLKQIFLDILKLAHPLVPFITEELWNSLAESKEFIIDQDFPKSDFKDTKSREIFVQVQEIISEIRRVRAENKVNPKDNLNIELISKIDADALKLIENLAKVSTGKIDENHSTKIFTGNYELLIEIPVDEKAVAAEIKKLESHIMGLKKRLENKKYVDSAPEKLVAETRENLKTAEDKLEKLKNS